MYLHTMRQRQKHVGLQILAFEKIYRMRPGMDFHFYADKKQKQNRRLMVENMFECVTSQN